MAITIETHYGKPDDIEWGLDGESGELFILQARPETVQSRVQKQVLERYRLNGTGPYSAKAAVLAAASGRARFAWFPRLRDLSTR